MTAPTLSRPSAPPAESPSAPADPERDLGPWIAFIRAHAALTRLLEAELQDAAGVSLADYEALLQLSLAGGRLRMNELADRLLLTRSGASRLVDRMADDGYVARHKCATDARGAFAVLTPAGLEHLERARPTAHEAISEHFLMVLPARDRAAFLRSLETILARLDVAVAPADSAAC
ncbi:MAG TPA: MarR family winged helix-turn-helix transcriptional regulator [Candidatus Sulfotelmatobacter sp.]|jgi:DNA-binding MarR family transcriptional regulator|nr:MarR family winged helix-turn-helix transcriptional regulator [Candidatus Sulfotelmatobacter sp.]